MVTSHSDSSDGSGQRARRSSRGRWVPLLALALALAPTRAALAQQDTEAAAQRLFREGRQAIERGDYVTGCPKFAESLKLVKRASTLLNLAQCEEHEGRLSSALERWKQGADLLEARDERLPIARGKIRALEQQLPRLTVTTTADMPAEAEILLDGAPLDRAKLGVETPLDPGRHTATVKAPGRAEVQITLELAAGERKQIELKPAEPVRNEAAGAAAAPTQPAGAVLSKRTVGFIVGGLGVAGLATAGVTGTLVISRDADIEEACPEKRCTPAGREYIAGSGPLLVGNAVAWVVGLAGIGAGAWLILTSGPDSKTAVSGTALPGGGWLAVRRSF
jgi:hypothetical protein